MKQWSSGSSVCVTGLVALVGAVPLAVAAPVSAQTPRPAVTAGWQDGFFVGSDDGAYRLTLGTVLQADGRFDVDDPPATTSTFALRKVRPVMAARVARFFDMRLVPDFGGGTVVLQDAYVDARFSDALRIRVGKDKTPLGYELLIGDPFVLFTERNPVADLPFAVPGEPLMAWAWSVESLDHAYAAALDEFVKRKFGREVELLITERTT